MNIQGTFMVQNHDDDGIGMSKNMTLVSRQLETSSQIAGPTVVPPRNRDRSQETCLKSFLFCKNPCRAQRQG